jgi:hypothetical protein
VKQEHLADDKICPKLVLDAYTNATRSPGQWDAFYAAVRVWRECNPNASPEMARPAVAIILAKKL